MPSALATFVAAVLGKANIGTTSVNRGQCVGLVEDYLSHQGLLPIWGNAKDLLANADPKVYRRVSNAPHNFPPPGAIVIWGGTWGGGYGHCAINLLADELNMVVCQQNNPDGAGVLLGVQQYNGVSGWLLLPGMTEPPVANGGA